MYSINVLIFSKRLKEAKRYQSIVFDSYFNLLVKVGEDFLL